MDDDLEVGVPLFSYHNLQGVTMINSRRSQSFRMELFEAGMETCRRFTRQRPVVSSAL